MARRWVHEARSSPRGHRALRTLVTATIAAVGGLAGVASGLPAGALLGSMLFVGVYSVATDGRAELVPFVRDGARILTGTTVGSLATVAVLSSLGAYLPWVLGATLAIIGIGLACGYVFMRWTGLDTATAMLAFSPGGLSEMSALAEEMGARTEVVVGVQVVRKLTTLAAVVSVISVGGLS